jgi:hypothetical protein
MKNTITIPASVITPTLDLLLSFSKSKGAKFIAVNGYVAKGSGELANHVVNLNVSYENAIAKDIEFLKALDVKTLNDKGLGKDLMEQARQALLGAFISPNVARSEGQKEAYTHICNGVKVHNKSGDIHIYAMAVSKKVLIAGTYKVVDSAPLTIAKDIVRKELKSTKYRQFKLSNMLAATVNGETFNFAYEG